MNAARRRLGLGMVVSACTIAALAGFLWWWTHPTAFRDDGISESMSRSVPLGHATFYTSIVSPSVRGAPTAMLRSATAHFAADSGAARVSFLVCHDGVVGLVSDPIARYCHGTTMLPATLDGAMGSRDSLVMAVVATRPGRVEIDKVTLDYRRGPGTLWQQGKQTIAARLTFSVR